MFHIILSVCIYITCTLHIHVSIVSNYTSWYSPHPNSMIPNDSQMIRFARQSHGTNIQLAAAVDAWSHGLERIHWAEITKTWPPKLLFDREDLLKIPPFQNFSRYERNIHVSRVEDLFFDGYVPRPHLQMTEDKGSIGKSSFTIYYHQ